MSRSCESADTGLSVSTRKRILATCEPGEGVPGLPRKSAGPVRPDPRGTQIPNKFYRSERSPAQGNYSSSRSDERPRGAPSRGEGRISTGTACTELFPSPLKFQSAIIGCALP
jgi:hypothetical protein